MHINHLLKIFLNISMNAIYLCMNSKKKLQIISINLKYKSIKTFY